MSQKLRKYGITNELAKFSKDYGRPAKRKEIIATCKVSRASLSEWENAQLGDKIQFGVDHAIEIARILGCRVSDLINEEGFSQHNT